MSTADRSATERIRAMTDTELTEYLWHRLRLDEPVDPPLDHRFGQEPPESVVIAAWRHSNDDPAFADRLVRAIRANLRSLTPQLDRLPDDPAMREQLASLAFLAGEVGAKGLVPDLAEVAHDLWAQLRADPGGALLINNPLFHVLNALSDLDDSADLAPLWRDILAASGNRGLRTIAWFGLSHTDPEGLLDRLSEVVEDRTIRLANVAWPMAHRYPGIARFAKAAREHLTPEQRARLRVALVEAGADPGVLRDFDDPPYQFLRLAPGVQPMRRGLSWAPEQLKRAA